jgi:hypothetical protein
MKRVCNTLEGNRKGIGKKCLEKKANKLIECLDSNIVKDVSGLRNKYYDLIQRHRWICNEIIKTVYPEFIQREVERIEKNKKTKNKKYPKLQRIFASDVVWFRDSIKASRSTVKYQK